MLQSCRGFSSFSPKKVPLRGNERLFSVTFSFQNVRRGRFLWHLVMTFLKLELRVQRFPQNFLESWGVGIWKWTLQRPELPECCQTTFAGTTPAYKTNSASTSQVFSEMTEDAFLLELLWKVQPLLNSVSMTIMQRENLFLSNMWRFSLLRLKVHQLWGKRFVSKEKKRCSELLSYCVRCVLLFISMEPNSGEKLQKHWLHPNFLEECMETFCQCHRVDTFSLSPYKLEFPAKDSFDGACAQ